MCRSRVRAEANRTKSVSFLLYNLFFDSLKPILRRWV